jgi:hypothetical protein
MPDFPNLEPIDRSFSFGEYPLSMQGAWGVSDIAFRHGLPPVGHQLTLTYQEISSSKAALIRSHHADQRGGLLPFDLSLAVFHGNPSPPLGPWKYSKPPEETHLDGGLVNVVVNLEAVLPE